MDSTLLSRASAFDTATLHEAAGQTGALPSAIKPLHMGLRVMGPAVTVHSPAGDNLMLHHAVYEASPGSVLVVNVSGAYEVGYWGEILTVAAQQRGIAGLVIDGCIRDAEQIEQLGFPIFCRGLCIRGTTKRGGGSVNSPISLGDAQVQPLDLVVGDRDGVVVIPAHEVLAALDAAERRVEHEAKIKRELVNGARTLELYGFG